MSHARRGIAPQSTTPADSSPTSTRMRPESTSAPTGAEPRLCRHRRSSEADVHRRARRAAVHLRGARGRVCRVRRQSWSDDARHRHRHRPDRDRNPARACARPRHQGPRRHRRARARPRRRRGRDRARPGGGGRGGGCRRSSAWRWSSSPTGSPAGARRRRRAQLDAAWIAVARAPEGQGAEGAAGRVRRPVLGRPGRVPHGRRDRRGGGAVPGVPAPPAGPRVRAEPPGRARRREPCPCSSSRARATRSGCRRPARREPWSRSPATTACAAISARSGLPCGSGSHR